MSALGDSDCREILTATSDGPMTVSELVDECNIPMATAYRKVERLVELELLEEGIRVRPRGRNSREYRLCVEAVHVTIPDRRAPAVSFSCAITGREPAERQRAKIWTDGGQLADDEECDQQRRLRKIFEDVTGTVAFVETQEQTMPSRYSDDERDVAVSEYVTATAKADGLSDAITAPEMSDESE